MPKPLEGVIILGVKRLSGVGRYTNIYGNKPFVSLHQKRSQFAKISWVTEMFNYFISFIQGIRVVDLVDIGIIATFIYLFLVWLKKAKARFILLGIIILASIYILARLFGLYLTTVVFQAFFAIFLIILVVIFQDEFRNFFERIAIWGISRRRRKSASFSQDIETLTGAIVNLSQKQIGALIVIRGRDLLERHLQAGVLLDGLLSQVLIESIFDPRVPSHDGAVIIEGERITRFSCHLPLSLNLQEIGRLGTRHAAALGLSECTDALCIVVSEERGTVSVAEAGKIKTLSDAQMLGAILEDFYRSRFPQKKRPILIDFLTGHSLEKLVAVIFACGLWLTFGYHREIIRRDFVIPLEYRSLSSERIIAEPKPKEVTITLSGSERAFKLIETSKLRLSLDMSKIKDGENKFLLTKDMVYYPRTLSLVHIEPDEIKLNVYRLISLTVPIEIKTHGRPPPDIVINEIKIIPAEVSVIVPSFVSLEKITLATEPIDLKSITQTTTLTPKLILPPEVRFPDDKYPEVKVIINVKEK